jgi:hypothetical protein
VSADQFCFCARHRQQFNNGSAAVAARFAGGYLQNILTGKVEQGMGKHQSPGFLDQAIGPVIDDL